MPLVRLVLIRHGETEWNRQGRMQGRLDSPLTKLGRAQALAAGRYVRHLECDALVHSDLGRALETAQLVAAESGLTRWSEPRLRERSLGIMEGLTKPQFRERHPQHFRVYETRDPDFVVPGGESLRQVFDRTQLCLESLVSDFEGATLAVVTHGGILDAVYRMVTGIALETPRRFPLCNASLNRISRHNEVWQLDDWGDITHLEALDGIMPTMAQCPDT